MTEADKLEILREEFRNSVQCVTNAAVKVEFISKSEMAKVLREEADKLEAE